MRKFEREKVPQHHEYDHFGSWNLLSEPAFDLEIGCGVGLHPIQYSIKNPDRKIVAIEHTKEKYKKFESRYLGNKSPKNLLGIHGNAISLITHEVPSDSVETCFFLYPNPEPQNKAKRWFMMPFFSEILRVLKTEGQIVLATNKAGYIEEAIQSAQFEWNLQCFSFGKIETKESPLSSELLHRDTSIPRTHFEKKYLQRNEDCFQAIFMKKS